MQNPAISKLVKGRGLNPWQLLCLHLLWETNLGPKSFWFPYLNLLPDKPHQESFRHPLLWNQVAVKYMYNFQEGISISFETNCDYACNLKLGTLGKMSERISNAR